MLDYSRQTTSLGLAGPLSALDAHPAKRHFGDVMDAADRTVTTGPDPVASPAMLSSAAASAAHSPPHLPSLAVLSHRIAIACGDDRTTVQYSRRWSRWTQRSTK